MKIWKLEHHKDSIQLMAADNDKYLQYEFYNFRGQAMPIEWTQYPLKTYRKTYKYHNFAIYLPYIPVVNDKTKEIIESLIKDLVEFLPAQHEKHLFYLVNVINVFDCIDHTHSVPSIIDDGVVQKYEKLYFDEKLLTNTDKRHIFKLPGQEAKGVYVSDEFRSLILENKLKGINFLEVWKSEINIEEIKSQESETQSKFNSYVEEINSQPGIWLNWNEAIKLLSQDNGIISRDWKIKKDQRGELIIGRLKDDLNYEFFSPIYIPPILLDLNWKEVEK
ncbi:imm11 family protein [Paenibacillus bovis]|uniref:Immunity MXAN-0049 protein domain-containing protein n=1 Tax=Paenibacillus bovis TaxID=1616788 RepID=A0A172ZH98_9BACL|nr:DUF1629 domain-containing protein [Paenibacillus bovis]ANF97014.1 hypothetical protein AR543_14040 [Paenibacillus bovis]